MRDFLIETYYQKRANEYDDIYLKPERQEDLNTLKYFVRNYFTGLHVLEVACGTGYWSEIIARNCKSLYATDISSAVLNVAGKKLEGMDNVELGLCDAYKLPHLERAFNAGFSGFWISHVPRQKLQTFLHDFHAVLHKGARVCFIDNRFVSGNSTPLLEKKDAEGNTYQDRRLNDGSEFTILKNYPSEKELRDLVSDFASDIEFINLKYYWCLTYFL